MSKEFKRIISFILLLVMLLPITSMASVGEDVSVTAWGAITMDADTGEILYEKNADKMLIPASMTKIMTTYIMFQEMEAGRMSKDTMIKVSDRVAKISRDKNYPMSVPLKSGGEYSADQFINLIMVPSASASCIAVAEHISGTEENFVKRMNQVAKEIGMDANFQNSHGARPHYVTSRGMAKLIKKFIDDYPEILNYTSQESITFNGKKYDIFNELIHKRKYQGVDGFKTGTIKPARFCLGATGTRDGRRVISVVLGSETNDKRYDDSIKLLDLSFAKIKEQDQSRKTTNLEIINAPESARANIEYNTKVKFTGVSKKYNHNGKFYVDDVLVKEFKNQEVKDNLELDIPFIKELKDKESIELKYVMEVPKGEEKIVTTIVNLNDKAPAIYKDLDNDIVENKIKELSKKSLMNGIGNGYFGTEKVTNRADFITVLGRFVENEGFETIKDNESIYKDVKSEDYFNKYVVWASEKEFTQGFKNEFMPQNSLTLEEAAKILTSFVETYELELKSAKFDGNIDTATLSEWAEESVNEIAKKDILYKNGSKTLKPKDLITRVDLVNILSSLVDSLEIEEN